MARTSEFSFHDSGASSEITRLGYPLTSIGIEAYLKDLTCLPVAASLLSYCDVGPWGAGGAESYLARFNVCYSIAGCELNSAFVMKALISAGGGKLHYWARRREILSAHHVPVSRWYWADQGMIVEDFYPLSHAHAPLQQLKLIATALDSLGFRCLSFLRDILCDEFGNPYYVDFGFDLGEPGSQFSDSAMAQFAKHVEGCSRR